MENNTDDLSLATLENVSEYLKERFALKDPIDLFTDIKMKHRKSYINMVNNIFYEFAKHKIDNSGQLRCDDPEDPLFTCYISGYPGYDRLESMEDLVADIRQAIRLRDQNLKPYKRRLGLGPTDKGKDQGIER